MARKGREFELLVEKIEKIALSDGAKISSPGYLPDRITGEPREVDILIEQEIGTTSVKIVIECRDRSAIQDTTWIEQLHTKLNDIKINKAIAVSSNGFSQPAQDKAKFYNIEIRTFGEVDTSLIKSWWHVPHINIVNKQFNITAVSINADLQGNDFRLSEDYQDPNAKLFTRNSDGQLLSLNEIFRDCVSNQIKDWETLHPGESLRIKINAVFAEPNDWFSVTLGEINFRIREIDFDVELRLVMTQQVQSRVARYQGDNKIFSDVIEYDNFPIGGNRTLQIIKGPDGSIRISTRPISE
jgi:hypothetical protein